MTLMEVATVEIGILGNVRMNGGRFVMDGDAAVRGYAGVNGTLESTSGGRIKLVI